MTNDANSNPEKPIQSADDPQDTPDLTPTAWTILGFLSLQPRSGYEIREAAKRSVGYFWGISDGQLYPQLKVLEGLELIQPFSGIEGPRSRQRWQLTPQGRTALRSWLAGTSAHTQIRDENLVKFLFASQEEPELLLKLIKERRTSFKWFLEAIQTVQPGATWEDSGNASTLTVPLLLQQYGVEFAQMVLQWCDRAEAALDTQKSSTQEMDKE